MSTSLEKSHVRSRKNVTKWTLFFHYVSIAIAITMGIILIPLYLKFIPLETYGAWLASGNILVWLTMVDPGLSTILQQRIAVAYGKSNHELVGEYLLAGVFISLFIAGFILGVAFIVSNFIPDWLNLGETVNANELINAFVLAAIGTSLIIFSYTFACVNQGLLSSIGVGFVNAISSVISIIVIILLLYDGAGLAAIAAGVFVRGIGYVVGNVCYLILRIRKEKLQFTYTLRKVPELLKLTAYTFQWKASSALANNFDLFIVARYLGAEIVPVLALTKRVPEMSRMFVERPSAAFMSSVSHLVGTDEVDKAKVLLPRLAKMIMWSLGGLVGGLLIFNDDFVRLWVGDKLYAGNSINLLLCLTIFLVVLINSLSNLCFSLGNIKGNSLVNVLQNVFTIILIVIGGELYGLFGIVLAPLLAMLPISIWYYPKIFSSLLGISNREIKNIFYEILYIIILTCVSVFIFKNVISTDWLDFCIYLSSYMVLYVAGLLFISKEGRIEFMYLYNYACRVLKK